MNFLKEEVLNQKEVKNMMQTLREMLFLIPARLIKTSGKWILKKGKAWFYRRPYEEALARIR